MIIIERFDKRQVEMTRMYNLDRNINPCVIILGQMTVNDDAWRVLLSNQLNFVPPIFFLGQIKEHHLLLIKWIK